MASVAAQPRTSREQRMRVLCDSASVWNFTVAPGWSRDEADMLKRALMKFGIGQWQRIQKANVLPGKNVQQLNCQAQRLLGQQSTKAFNGLCVDLDKVRADNDAKTDAKRKNGLVINSGINPTKESVAALRKEIESKYKLTQQRVDNIELQRPLVALLSLSEDADLTRMETIVLLRHTNRKLESTRELLADMKANSLTPVKADRASGATTPPSRGKGAAAGPTTPGGRIRLPAKGDRLRVFWDGDMTWYEGKVESVLRHNEADKCKYTVAYDDGGVIEHDASELWETADTAAKRRLLDAERTASQPEAPKRARTVPPPKAHQPLPLREMRVRVHWDGEGESYVGRVTDVAAASGESWYMVHYPEDDETVKHEAGERWEAVAEDWAEPLPELPSPPATGETVRVHRKDGEWHQGTVVDAGQDWYTVRYAADGTDTVRHDSASETWETVAQAVARGATAGGASGSQPQAMQIDANATGGCGGAEPAAAEAAALAEKARNLPPGLVQQLMVMGFPCDKAADALLAAGGDLEAAVDALFKAA